MPSPSEPGPTEPKPVPAGPSPILINGWTLFAHPLLLDQIDRLVAAVAREARPVGDASAHSANAKLLAALYNLIFIQIPEDPTRTLCRQGATLGPDRKHWFRAKLGNGRFRLFFRFDLKARVIIYAWVNDEHSLRTRGARTDAYATFARMLEAGHPPDGWGDLLKVATQAAGRFGGLRPRQGD